MLSFRSITAFIAVLLVAGILGGWQWPTITLLVFGYAVLLFWGSYRVDSQFYMPVICEGSRAEKKIAISFDDGPDEQHTAAVLDILKDKQVPAAFFLVGHKIDGREALLQRAVAEGHVLGNHSYSHAPLFDLYGWRRILGELQQVNEKIRSVIGHSPRLFRPPYGVTTPPLAKAVRKSGMKAVGWNIRSLDTMAKDPEKLFLRVVRSLQPGAILLFHDTVPLTVAILPQLIDAAREAGFEWVRLDALINESPYE